MLVPFDEKLTNLTTKPPCVGKDLCGSMPHPTVSTEGLPLGQCAKIAQMFVGKIALMSVFLVSNWFYCSVLRGSYDDRMNVFCSNLAVIV